MFVRVVRPWRLGRSLLPEQTSIHMRELRVERTDEERPSQMKNLLRGVRVAVLGAAVLVSYVTFVAVSPPVAGADTAVTAVTAFYLDIGASESLGVQPTVTNPRGQRTHQGYADDLVAQEAAKGVTLDLHEIGCSGETTATMMSGNDHCYSSLNTQLNVALSFLRTHFTENGLVTIDLGFNDLLPCRHNWITDQYCVARQLDAVHQNLTEIIGLLKDAAGPNVKFIGVGHYDPYLGIAPNIPLHLSTANASLRVVRQLNQVLGDVYGSFGIPMAAVDQAFKSNSTARVKVAGRGSISANVAEVCLLTWMCQPAPMGPNIHPNDAGYQTIANTIEQLLTPW